MRSVPARYCPRSSSASPLARLGLRWGPPRTSRPSSPAAPREAGSSEEQPMFDLTGRTALVTGATGGIGSAIARALHGQGAVVAISGTRREALDALATELADRVHVLPCNLADKEQVEKLAPDAEQAMGQLDILVNNAGITR